MSLNELASTLRSGSSVGSSRVSSRPPAIALAAWAATPTGRTARRAANWPASTPSAVVMTVPSTSDRRTERNVSVTSSRLKNSKYAALLRQRVADDDVELVADLDPHRRRRSRR